MYRIINTYDTTTNGIYVIKYISEASKLHNYTQIEGKVISADELVVKAKYLSSMHEIYNWYWKQQSLKHNIIAPTRTVIHPCLDLFRITDVQDIPKTVCNRIQEKNPYKDILFV